MSQSLYPSSLLNELHTWFPDILYNPGRFHNVQDLLAYIRQIADISPYQRGLYQYQSRIQMTRPQQVSSNPFASQPFPTFGSAASNTVPPRPERRMPRPSVNQVEPEMSYEYTATTSINGTPVTARISTLPISASIIESDDMENLTEQSINTMLNQLLSNNILRNFLDQNVVVAPTTQQIELASSVENVSSTLEDNCTICQDAMEDGQQVRRLSHCHHVFHKSCIDTWFQRNVHCPTCRHDIREVENIRQPPPVSENHRRTNIRE